jgi:hypothetical protein
MEPDVISNETMPCGCKTTRYVDGKQTYTPCLPCSLINAGLMLQEAGKRLREQAA